MTNWTLHPRGFDADGLPDGQYGVTVVGGKVTAFSIVNPPGIQSIIPGTRIAVDDTDPDNPVVSLASELYVLTTVIDGEPTEVWDETELVYTEVSLP